MSTQNYSTQKSGSWIDKLALKKRLQMFDLFLQQFPESACQSILDAGATADQADLSSNFLEKYYPQKQKIIALSNQDADFLEDIYRGLTFKKGDILALPFADDSIDVVFSAAVIEHIGAFAQQKIMLAECLRVAKKGIFITTPNRWHPIEVHTLLPFLHWLPKRIHRKLLKRIGLSFYASEENLNLLEKKTVSNSV